jgi:hypothetical protein
MIKEYYKSIRDLIEMTEMKDADIEMLMKDAYARGFKDGIDFTKEKMIDTIIKNS